MRCFNTTQVSPSVNAVKISLKLEVEKCCWHWIFAEWKLILLEHDARLRKIRELADFWWQVLQIPFPLVFSQCHFQFWNDSNFDNKWTSKNTIWICWFEEHMKICSTCDCRFESYVTKNTEIIFFILIQKILTLFSDYSLHAHRSHIYFKTLKLLIKAHKAFLEYFFIV